MFHLTKESVTSINLIKYKEFPSNTRLKIVHAIFYFNNETDRDTVFNEIKDKPVDKYIEEKLDISFMLPLIKGDTEIVLSHKNRWRS
jgi:hypothetical protein